MIVARRWIEWPASMTQRRCAVCNSTLFGQTMKAKVCSRRCRDASRRSRKRGVFVESITRRRVFDRDDWRCQLCGQAVPKQAEVPDPAAPTLDHIIPLAAGGTHEYSNVQLAHFLCNSLKGNRAGLNDDQLRLVSGRLVA
jgi:5-methylcytosine-specific restriction endonuclease McrA